MTNAKTRLAPAILAVLAAALLTTACNTVAGAGRDVESVGEAVQDVAN